MVQPDDTAAASETAGHQDPKSHDESEAEAQDSIGSAAEGVTDDDDDDDVDDEHEGKFDGDVDWLAKSIMNEVYARFEAFADLADERIEKQRRADREERKRTKRAQRPSLPNVEGAIPKETLRSLSNKTLRELILHARKEVERYETENFLYERTIEKLEKPEKDIELRYPGADADSSKNLKDSGPAICPSESDEEPEDTGVYVALNPIDEIHVSTDSFFDNMSDISKGATLQFFQDVGEIAPANFDVMRFTYGDLVKGATEEVAEEKEEVIMDKTRLGADVLASRAVLDEADDNIGTETKGEGKNLNLDSLLEDIRMDEDPEYPGFSMSTAKELPIEDKLKFALEEEEEFRNEFYKHETLALREEGALQVHIDAHKHSARLLLSIRKDFRAVMDETRHPVTGKVMAELVLRFKRKMRNQISAEETKTRMIIRKLLGVKKRAIHQLKTNKDSGFAISQIDFEHLMCENQIFVEEMEEMNLSLKYLKQLSGHFFQILKEDQTSIGRLKQEDARLTKEVENKKILMKKFQKTYQKYKTMITEINARVDNLKRKLSEYHAPSTFEYIRLKSVQYEMESDVATLQKKLDEINLSLVTARGTFAKYCKLLPEGDQTEFENEKWLDDIKREVEEKGLLALLDDDEDLQGAQGVPSIFKRASLGKETASQVLREAAAKAAKEKTERILKAGKIKNVQAILLATTRPKRKSRKPDVYDMDFEFELSSSKPDKSTTML